MAVRSPEAGARDWLAASGNAALVSEAGEDLGGLSCGSDRDVSAEAESGKGWLGVSDRSLPALSCETESTLEFGAALAGEFLAVGDSRSWPSLAGVGLRAGQFLPNTRRPVPFLIFPCTAVGDTAPA